MDLQTIFYILGSIFFFFSLVLLIVVGVSLIYFYIQFKKTAANIKQGINYAKNIKDISGKLPAFIVPVILFVLNFIFKKIKARFDA